MDKTKLYTYAETLANEFEEISEYIYDHPELGNDEYASSAYLCEKMKAYGFEVTYPYCGLDTAFRAELTCGDGPKVAFLAEYDALPGYGENGDKNAHACGHNWIAASTLGAAVILSKMKDEIQGSIVLIGTPAEETIGGKCDLVDRGAFDDIDAAIQMHLGAKNNINVVTLAMDSIQFDFTGKAAHAAAYPELGINALRQHMKSDARVHGIVTEGGQAVNTVPDKASCKFYIRAKHRAYLEELTKRIIDCAKGAALMTGAQLNYFNFENSYDDMVYHEGLRTTMIENLSALGICDFVKEDAEASGSSDIGNVSHVCPSVYCEIDTGAKPSVHAHNEEFLEYVHGEYAKKTLRIAIQAMAGCAFDIFENPDIVK